MIKYEIRNCFCANLCWFIHTKLIIKTDGICNPVCASHLRFTPMSQLTCFIIKHIRVYSYKYLDFELFKNNKYENRFKLGTVLVSKYHSKLIK